MSRILFILSIFLLVSCSASLDIQLGPEVSVFHSTNNELNKQLTPNDNEYLALDKWLQEHNTGWHSTSGRYRGGVYLTTENYGIQITKTHVILYSIKLAKPEAIYIQELGKGELNEVRSLGN